MRAKDVRVAHVRPRDVHVAHVRPRDECDGRRDVPGTYASHIHVLGTYRVPLRTSAPENIRIPRTCATMCLGPRARPSSGRVLASRRLFRGDVPRVAAPHLVAPCLEVEAYLEAPYLEATCLEEPYLVTP